MQLENFKKIMLKALDIFEREQKENLKNPDCYDQNLTDDQKLSNVNFGDLWEWFDYSVENNWDTLVKHSD